MVSVPVAGADGGEPAAGRVETEEPDTLPNINLQREDALDELDMLVEDLLGSLDELAR